MTASPNSHNEQNVVSGVDETRADFGAENSLLAELKDIKRSLLIMEKQVEANTRSLLINPQNQDNITNEEFIKQKEKCESLQATLCNKDEEINELKIKTASLETRAASAEQKNDSLGLALKLIMQEKRDEERKQRKNQNFVETFRQDKSKNEAQQQLEKSKPAPQRDKRNPEKNKKEPQSGPGNNAQTTKPVIVITGDSIIQNIRSWSLSKTHTVVVKPFPGGTTEDMEDFIQLILRREPENIIIHVATNVVNSQEPRLTSEGIVNLALQIEGDAPNISIAISGSISGGDDKERKVSSVNKILKKFCYQKYWNFIKHNNVNFTHLNRRGLHLFKSDTALLAQNFCATAVWNYNQIPDPPISTNCRSMQKANGKSVFGRGLVMACLKINSLVSHIDDLRVITNQLKDIDILAVSETKLDPTIKDSEVHLPGYDVVRKDRESKGRNGGGVYIFVRSNINFQLPADLSPRNLECLTIVFTVSRNKHGTKK